MRYVVAAFILLSAGVAHAGGGIELDEHDAKGVGTAGAQTAIADNPAAVYYNPAGLAFQPGFGAEAGGNLIIARTHVDPDNITLWHPVLAPHFYLSQRFGKYVAFGIGMFAEYGEHFDFGSTWRGRFQGYFVDLTTANINPNLAFRLTPWLAIGGGLDIVLGSIDLYRALQFGGAEGGLHIGGDALGFGGNVAILVKLIPDHLNLGFSYRSHGDLKLADAAYDTALKLNPKHTGALEYQGILYIKLGKADEAKSNLGKIKAICGTTCTEYKDLAKALGV